MRALLQKTIQKIDHIFTHKFPLFLSLLVALVLLSTLVFNYLGFFEPIESRLIDLRFETRSKLQHKAPAVFGTPRVASSDLVMVNITDECLDSFGKWPWSRQIFGRLVESLENAGASVVAFDISFYDTDEKDPRGDDRLVQSLKRANKIVLASELVRSLRLVPRDGVLELPGMNDEQSGTMVIEEKQAHYEFMTKGVHSGYVNIHVTDGMIREFPILKKVNGRVHRSLALESFHHFVGEGVIKVGSEQNVTIGDYQIPVWNRLNKAELISRFFQHSIDTSLFDNFVYLNYLGSSNEGHFPSFSVSRILGKKEDLRIFKDKIVLIGFNAHSLDKKLTPYGIMPGVEVQATVIENLLSHSFLKRVENLPLSVFLLICSLCLLYLNMRFDLRSSFLLNLVFSALLILISSLLFCRNQLILDLTPPLFLTWVQFGFSKLAILSQSLRWRMIHLEQLNTISRELFTILDSDRLGKTIFEMMQEYTSCTKGVILTIDQVNEQIEYSNYGTMEDDFMVSISRKEFRDEVFGIWQDKPFLTLLGDLEGKIKSPVPNTGDTQVLLLPLLHKAKPYGIIFLFKDNFKEEMESLDQSFWVTMCQIIVAALENARLYKLATVDGLTGLFVRQFFDVQIHKEFYRATRYGEKVGYMMSDIDHFKNFNDTYGHEMGDRVLRLVADEIKKSVRSVDIAARYGGEELCVILPNTDKEGSLNIAERVRQNIESLKIPHEGEEIRITCSVGVSSIPENNPVDVKEFLKQADLALYEAKDNGRNQVVYYERKQGRSE